MKCATSTSCFTWRETEFPVTIPVSPLDLHSFPGTNPSLLGKWIWGMHQRRSVWSHTKTSCSSRQREGHGGAWSRTDTTWLREGTPARTSGVGKMWAGCWTTSTKRTTLTIQSCELGCQDTKINAWNLILKGLIVVTKSEFRNGEVLHNKWSYIQHNSYPRPLISMLSISTT